MSYLKGSYRPTVIAVGDIPNNEDTGSILTVTFLLLSSHALIPRSDVPLT